MARTRQRIAEIIGDPDRLRQELRSFREQTEVLSSERSKLIDEYPQQWVAIYGDRVRAHGLNLEEVLEHVEAMGLPREHVVVRFIDRDVGTLIL